MSPSARRPTRLALALTALAALALFALHAALAFAFFRLFQAYLPALFAQAHGPVAAGILAAAATGVTSACLWKANPRP